MYNTRKYTGRWKPQLCQPTRKMRPAITVADIALIVACVLVAVIIAAMLLGLC